MSSRLQKFFGRKGTRGKYGAEDEQRTLPEPQEDKPTIAKPDDKKKAKEDDAIDDKVDDEHKAEKTDDVTNVSTPAVKKTVDGHIPKDKAGTSSQGTPSGVYSRLWKSSTSYTLSPIRYTASATWVPNSIPVRELLMSMSRLVGQSNYALKHKRSFLPYAFETGIIYLLHMQTLRAQKAAGDLLGLELSALTRFSKFNDLSGIMIPEPLIPFFESIVSTELEDTKYGWIYPSYFPGEFEAKTLQELCRLTPLDHLRPNVLFMLANLAKFAATESDDVALTTGRIFVPITPDGTTHQARFLGRNATFHGPITKAQAEHLEIASLTAAGANIPFKFWNENYLDAHEAIRNSNFFIRGGIDIGLDNSLRVPGTARNLNDTKRFAAYDEYLFAGKNNNPSWFRFLAEQINTVAAFFPGSKPFSKIATVGGMEPTIICQLKNEFETNFAIGTAAAADHYISEDMWFDKANLEEIKFYQSNTINLSGSFDTTRGDIERNEELNALSLAINANPPFYMSDIQQATIRSGQIFEDIRAGSKAMQVKRLGFTRSTIPGEKPMYGEFHNDFVLPAFSKVPNDA